MVYFFRSRKKGNSNEVLGKIHAKTENGRLNKRKRRNHKEIKWQGLTEDKKDLYMIQRKGLLRELALAVQKIVLGREGISETVAKDIAVKAARVF